MLSSAVTLTSPQRPLLAAPLLPTPTLMHNPHISCTLRCDTHARRHTHTHPHPHIYTHADTHTHIYICSHMHLPLTSRHAHPHSHTYLHMCESAKVIYCAFGGFPTPVELDSNFLAWHLGPATWNPSLSFQPFLFLHLFLSNPHEESGM